MDQNIAALLREDVVAANVVFVADTPETDTEIIQDMARRRGKVPFGAKFQRKTYTYICDKGLALKVGDKVVVEARGMLTVAEVESFVEVGDAVTPNSDTYYKWIIAKVDFSLYEANVQRNREIEATVAKAYTRNLRRSFAQQVLGCVDDPDEASRIRALLSAPTAKVAA